MYIERLSYGTVLPSIRGYCFLFHFAFFTITISSIFSSPANDINRVRWDQDFVLVWFGRREINFYFINSQKCAPRQRRLVKRNTKATVVVVVAAAAAAAVRLYGSAVRWWRAVKMCDCDTRHQNAYVWRHARAAVALFAFTSLLLFTQQQQHIIPYTVVSVPSKKTRTTLSALLMLSFDLGIWRWVPMQRIFSCPELISHYIIIILFSITFALCIIWFICPSACAYEIDWLYEWVPNLLLLIIMMCAHWQSHSCLYPYVTHR